jgi:hypothetical protein
VVPAVSIGAVMTAVSSGSNSTFGTASPPATGSTLTSTFVAPSLCSASAWTSMSPDHIRSSRSSAVRPSVSAASLGHWLLSTPRSLIGVISNQSVAGDPSGFNATRVKVPRAPPRKPSPL